MSTLPTSNPKAVATATTKSKAEARSRKTHNFLQQLHFCGTLTVKTIASALLITVFLWLFARLPDPQVHVTGFSIQALKATTKPYPTIINYNFTIHNPDLYKSLHYIVLVLRISYSGNFTKYGATIDFDVDGNGITQGPGKTKVLPEHTLDYSYTDLWDVSDQLLNLKTIPEYMRLHFVMEFKVIAFNRAIASRQLMKTAQLYFDKAGNAIISHPGGLALR